MRSSAARSGSCCSTTTPRPSRSCSRRCRRRPSAIRGPGVLAGKLLFPDGRVQWAGQRVGLRTGYSGRPRGHGQPDGLPTSVEGRTDRAVGALMAVSREAIDARGCSTRTCSPTSRTSTGRCASARRASSAVRPGGPRLARVAGLDRRRGVDADRLLRRAQHDRRVRAPPPAAGRSARRCAAASSPGTFPRRAALVARAARPCARCSTARATRARAARSAQRALVGLRSAPSAVGPGEARRPLAPRGAQRCARPRRRAGARARGRSTRVARVEVARRGRRPPRAATGMSEHATGTPRASPRAPAGRSPRRASAGDDRGGRVERLERSGSTGAEQRARRRRRRPRRAGASSPRSVPWPVSASSGRSSSDRASAVEQARQVLVREVGGDAERRAAARPGRSRRGRRRVGGRRRDAVRHDVDASVDPAARSATSPRARARR